MNLFLKQLIYSEMNEGQLPTVSYRVSEPDIISFSISLYAANSEECTLSLFKLGMA